jgi:hypothetical protein
MVLKRFHVPPFDEVPNEQWETRDIALWAARSVSEHERVCSERWGVLIRLMWVALSGIGLIATEVVKDYLSLAVTALSKVH